MYRRFAYCTPCLGQNGTSRACPLMLSVLAKTQVQGFRFAHGLGLAEGRLAMLLILLLPAKHQRGRAE